MLGVPEGGRPAEPAAMRQAEVDSEAWQAHQPTLPETLCLAEMGLKGKWQGTGPCQRLAQPIQLSILSLSLVTYSLGMLLKTHAQFTQH